MDLQAGPSPQRQVIEISDDEDDEHDNALEGYGEDDLANQEFLAGLNYWPLPLAPKPSARRHSVANDEPFSPSAQQPVGVRGSDLAAGKQAPPTRDACIAGVRRVFPQICPQHIRGLCDEHGNDAGAILAVICEAMDQGMHYPKIEEQKNLKRKRELTAAEEAQTMYSASNREDEIPSVPYTQHAREVLGSEFKRTPMRFIEALLRARPTCYLFDAYKVLEEAERTYEDSDPRPYIAIQKAREMKFTFSRLGLERPIQNLRSELPQTPHELKVAEELFAARTVRQEADDRRAAEKLAEEAELLNTRIAEEEGTMTECGCCFGDYPLNRMVHCSEGLHFFCRACANRTAEEVIGNSKYQITCMSMDGCSARFSRDQMLKFLDEKSFIALDRNEQEAVLRIADIENLASCPFCPYAAEYPPVEEDKEFRCQAPDCAKVSCRLCNLETHIPKSCGEFAKENGLSIRRQIEEAMTAALIRTCNKCSTPFVKETGCNKMTCTRNGCRNVQCYVCSKSCDYNHFNDPNRGGNPGNCPLFEDVEGRHEQEVRKAEDEAVQRVRADHPEYSEGELRIQVSESVKKDDEKRRAKNPGPVHGHAVVPVYAEYAHAFGQDANPHDAFLPAIVRAGIPARANQGLHQANAQHLHQAHAEHLQQARQILQARQIHPAQPLVQQLAMLGQHQHHQPMQGTTVYFFADNMQRIFGEAAEPANFNQQFAGNGHHILPEAPRPPQLRRDLAFNAPARLFESLRGRPLREAEVQRPPPPRRPFLRRLAEDRPDVNAAKGEKNADQNTSVGR